MRLKIDRSLSLKLTLLEVGMHSSLAGLAYINGYVVAAAILFGLNALSVLAHVRRVRGRK